MARSTILPPRMTPAIDRGPRIATVLQRLRALITDLTGLTGAALRGQLRLAAAALRAVVAAVVGRRSSRQPLQAEAQQRAAGSLDGVANVGRVATVPARRA
jgi:hypothetical protein